MARQAQASPYLQGESSNLKSLVTRSMASLSKSTARPYAEIPPCRRSSVISKAHLLEHRPIAQDCCEKHIRVSSFLLKSVSLVLMSKQCYSRPSKKNAS